MKNWDNQTTEELINAILAFKDKSEAKLFLRDLLTEEELIEFGKRWQTAQMLNKKIPYTQIEKKTGLSSTTVARVAKWLKNGMGGYQLMLNKLSHTHHNSNSTKSGLR